MGCAGSRHTDSGAGMQSSYQQQQQPPAYAIPSNMVPPSTLPQGWISQFDGNKQRLYYAYPQTGLVTWAHPLGQQADAQEMARFYQIRQLQQQQFGNGVNQSAFASSYNSQGGMGTGASLAIGMMAGGAMGLMAGSMMGGGMGMGGMGMGGMGMGGMGMGGMGMNDGYSNDVIPASTDFGGGDFGGGDFGGGDFGGGF